jgi:HAE1 family hydrophobic/amphiphilic exporter-1
MKILKFFVTHPVTMCMVLMATLVFGVISVKQLSLDMLPDINYPVVAIVTLYPGADALTVEREVTNPVEDSLGTIKGLKRLQSQSIENASIILAYLNWGSDLSASIEDVNSILRIASLTLPSDCQPPLALKWDSSQLPAMLIGVTADMDLADLTRTVDSEIRPILESVSGVAQISVLGGLRPIINVYYNTDKLREHWLTPLEIAQMIDLQNLVIPAGHYEMPGLNGQSQNLIRYNFRAGSNIESVEDLKNLVVGTSQSSSGNNFSLSQLLPPVVYLKDLAEVKEEFPEPEGLTRINDKQALVLRVIKQVGENTVRLNQQLRNTLQKLQIQHPNLNFVVITDQSESINQSLTNLSSAALVGGFLALLILLVFLKNLHNLIIISFSIPFSVLIGLIMMRFNGMSLNIMTLGGLALGIGMLVDNSIVVLESIFRHHSQGEDLITSSVNGSSEVAAAITSSTLTTLAVFVPLVFIQSVMGYLFRDLALAVSFTLVGSLLAALIVIPVLFAHLPFRTIKPIKQSVSFVERSKKAYLKILEACIKKPVYVLGLVLVLIAALIGLPRYMDIAFFPEMDQRMITINLSLPAGTTLWETDALIREIETVSQSYPEVESVVTYIGNQGGDDYYSMIDQEPVHSATVTLLLTARQNRTKDSHQIAEELKQAINYPQARMRISADRASDALGDDFKMSLKMEISGSDFKVLEGLAQSITGRLRETQGFTDIFSSIEESLPEVFFKVKRDQSLQANLTTSQIALNLRYAMLGLPVTNLNRDGQIIEVYMKPNNEEVSTYEDLLSYKILALGSGQAQPPKTASLGAITEQIQTTNLSTITHTNRQRVVTIQAELDGISFVESKRLVDNIVNSMEIPLGYAVTLEGIHRTLNESMGDFYFIVLLAILLVYMVMAAQFESFVLPLIIMILLPISGSGAVFALWISGCNLDFPALLGVLVLVGVVVNNGIVLIDAINQSIRQGSSTKQAIQTAASIRYRPILMTSLTTILGLLPMAVGWGEGTEFQVPLSIAVIGGLVSSTILTLFVIPTLYSMIKGAKLPKGKSVGPSMS